MTLLRKIQDTAVDSTTNLADVLRQCAVLGARLRHREFKKWVDKELNGYFGDAKLPEYRVIQGLQSTGDFVGPFGRQARNIPLPVLNVPEAFRKRVSSMEFREGVGELAAMVEGRTGDLQSPWPPDLIAHVSDRFIRGDNLIAARISLPRSTVVGILDSVRNRVLKFVLEIDAQAPQAGEDEAGPQKISEDRVTQIFNTNIMGGSNIAVGSSRVKQVVQVQVGDLNSLKAHLSGHGVDPKDVQGLETILREERPPKEGSEFGKRVSGWIGEMTAKAASGTWKIGVGAAGGLLASALRAYFGWP